MSIGHCRFAHNISLFCSDGRITLFNEEGMTDYQPIEEVDENCKCVALMEGLVHIITHRGVYQIKAHPDFVFAVQFLGTVP